MDFCVNSLKFSFSDSFILLSSPTNLSTNLLGQPRNRSVRIQSSIFVVWELRDYNKMLEKAGIKIIDFDDFVFCTTESKSILYFRAFPRSLLLATTKVTKVDIFSGASR